LYPMAGGGVRGGGIASIKAATIDAEVKGVPKWGTRTPGRSRFVSG
jgi:hypothetical protein